MESCFRSAEMYAGCPDADHALAPGTVATVTGAGLSYFVSRTSATGTTFTIQRLAHGYSRTCTDPGVGGCGGGGSR